MSLVNDLCAELEPTHPVVPVLVAIAVGRAMRKHGDPQIAEARMREELGLPQVRQHLVIDREAANLDDSQFIDDVYAESLLAIDGIETVSIRPSLPRRR